MTEYYTEIGILDSPQVYSPYYWKFAFPFPFLHLKLSISYFVSQQFILDLYRAYIN